NSKSRRPSSFLSLGSRDKILYVIVAIALEKLEEWNREGRPPG
ncbi:hypothetical protein RRG08_065066, partial [Elysia crispata]